MRYKEDHKEQTHKRIVETASREFRIHGFDGIGIARLMALLQLTHGGFYSHFEGKEDLFEEAMSSSLDQSLNFMVQELKQGGIASLVHSYTDNLHRDNPGRGCPLPALSGEEARRPPGSRESFTRKYDEIVATIAGYVPGATAEERMEKVLVMFAALSGAVSLARAVSDPALSDRILRATRDHLIEYLSGE
ncbi:MAG TPA: TetR/AcrR family transcriptional regulator [Chthonomonadaceae bacterium]|nr:TetR/AcrR family transcriptional regulator [Chthonomonadaceae bacterium]